MSNVVLLVRYKVKKEHRTAFEALIRNHARLTLEQEPGCLQFDVLIPREGGEDHVHLYEVYRDDAAFADHQRGTLLPIVREQYKDMLDAREIVVCSR